MRQCKVAFRNLIHRCKSITTRPLCCGVELLGKQQLILPLYTCTTSSPRNYSKFSTHITTERAMNLLCNLDEEERSNLRSALDKIDADKEKKLYEKESASEARHKIFKADRKYYARKCRCFPLWILLWIRLIPYYLVRVRQTCPQGLATKTGEHPQTRAKMTHLKKMVTMIERRRVQTCIYFSRALEDNR
ncbi:uncharacterized protein [Drosophila suzukii]|uniref:Uncharacterized protein isoform X5 n=1 Tax=Drosophila suzukii TaxID=28584 RepID=A0ABM4TWM5_DROSZ|nr:uncharacterized protein LOC108015917 isoform X5 [Drosophila suzukii]